MGAPGERWRGYSGLSPAAFTTLLHFSASDLMNALAFSGVPPVDSVPNAASFSCTSRSFMIGPYDVVFTFDAPDGEIAAKAKIDNMSLGNAHWTILRLFGEQEMGRILKGLPSAKVEVQSRQARK